MKHYVDFWKQGFNFAGKATRAQYWLPWFINIIISVVLGALVFVSTALTVAVTIFELAILIPSLAIFWRRMHDTGRSGLNILWFLLPIVGWIIVLVFLLDRSK